MQTQNRVFICTRSVISALELGMLFSRKKIKIVQTWAKEWTLYIFAKKQELERSRLLLPRVTSLDGLIDLGKMAYFTQRSSQEDSQEEEEEFNLQMRRCRCSVV